MLTQVAINGIGTSAVYVMLALGLVLSWGLGRTVNFAHGDMALWGAYIFLPLAAVGSGIWLGLSTLAAAGVVGIAGLIFGRTIFEKLEGNHMAGLIAALGLVFILQGAAISVWGLSPRSGKAFVSGVAEFGGTLISWQRVLVVAITFATVTALWLGLNRTRIGADIRALSEDVEAAEAVGLPVRRLYLGLFALGSALAGLAGVMYVSLFPITPFASHVLVLKAFLVAALGGATSVVGVVIAGFIVGLAEAFGAQYISAPFQDAYGLVALVIVMIMRPEGLGMVVRRAV